MELFVRGDKAVQANSYELTEKEEDIVIYENVEAGWYAFFTVMKDVFNTTKAAQIVRVKLHF